MAQIKIIVLFDTFKFRFKSNDVLVDFKEPSENVLLRQTTIRGSDFLFKITLHETLCTRR